MRRFISGEIKDWRCLRKDESWYKSGGFDEDSYFWELDRSDDLTVFE